jgi:hypothetical protein
MRSFANPADHVERGRLWWNLFPPSVLAARRQALHAQLFIPRIRFHFPTTAAAKKKYHNDIALQHHTIHKLPLLNTVEVTKRFHEKKLLQTITGNKFHGEH